MPILMSPTSFLLLVSVGIIVVLGTVLFSKKAIFTRSLSRIPFSSVPNLKTDELSKLYGKALHVKTPLRSPCTQRECVLYQLKIEQYGSNGKQSGWNTLIEVERFQEFFLECNGDLVIVKPTTNPKNYNCFLTKDKIERISSSADPSPEFKALLNDHDIKIKNWLGFKKTLRYQEGVIEIGEYITLAGIAKWKSLSEPIPEYPYSKIAALESTAQQKLLITDLRQTFPKNSVSTRNG